MKTTKEKREDAIFRISTRNKILKEQDNKCFYCNRILTQEKATLDHIIPISKGDTTLNDNGYVVACKRCNKAKGDNVVFTNLFDKEIYVIVDVPYIFRSSYIQTNKFKGIKK